MKKADVMSAFLCLSFVAQRIVYCLKQSGWFNAAAIASTSFCRCSG
ncbi:hypothetical protein VCLMA_A0964 [Vibrio cholerae LMA3984-4]|nr:hypothetical protein VCLMA_A0964 [Vibrio cholerae LMA3984-4]